MPAMPNSFKNDLIAKYTEQSLAEAAQAAAAQQDTEHTYKVRYSWKNGVWIVAVMDKNGGLYGYLHPIKQ
jgi:hypothetical protein